MPRFGMLIIDSLGTPTRLAAILTFLTLGVLATESQAVELCGVTKVQSGESGFTVTLQGWNQGASFAVYRTDDKERRSPLRVSPLQSKFVLNAGESAVFLVGIHGGCIITVEQRNARFGVQVEAVEHSNGEERKASTFMFAELE